MNSHKLHRTTDDRSSRSEIDRIIEACEQSWQRGERPPIEELLQAHPNVDQTALLIELVHLELELRLAAGEPARVEEYLSRYPQLAADRPVVLQLLRTEYEMRQQRESGVDLAEFTRRFPWCGNLLPTELARPVGPRRGRVALRLNCPHCQNPIEIVDDQQQPEDIVCPSCGSSFKVAQDLAHTWKPEKLPKLGKFELLEAVGRGAFGTVYRARDTELQRTVAIKLPRSGSLATKEDEDRFIREARSVAQLRHPNIVSIHETGRSEQFPYIVSEFVEGVTLADLLTGRKLSPRESAQLIATVAEALQYAHDQGVIHRDVKPSNIILDDLHQPHLMDFGLARRDVGEITMTMDGQVLGTPAYMSPEQARGEGHKVDGRSDVYSLGVILYELLTGELPFRGNSRMLLHQVLKDEPRALRSLNDRIPKDLETICLKAMAKEPGRRYTTGKSLSDDLRRWLSGKPIHARPVGNVERGWRWCQRNPALASLSAIVAIVLALSSVVSTFFGLEAGRRAADAIAERARADEEAAVALAEKVRADRSATEALVYAEKATDEAKRAADEALRANLEAEKAGQVAEFLGGLFEESAPLEFGGVRFESADKFAANANLSAQQILDRGAHRVKHEMASQPLVQAELLDRIGNVYIGLGRLDDAEQPLQTALELREQHLPPEHLDLARSFHSVGALRLGQFQGSQSAEALSRAYAIRRKLLGDNHELTDASRFALSMVVGLFRPNDFRKDSANALNLARESLSWRRANLGDKHIQTAFAMLLIAGASLNTGDEAEAARMLLQATPILLNNPATKSIGVTVAKYQQSVIFQRLGQQDRAAKAIQEAMHSVREVGTGGHPFVIVFENFAIDSLIDLNKIDDAAALCREAIEHGRSRSKKPTMFDVELGNQMTRILTKKFHTTQDHSILLEAEQRYRDSEADEVRVGIFPSTQRITLSLQIAGALEPTEPSRAEELYQQAIGNTKKKLKREKEQQPGERLRVDAFARAVYAFGSYLRRTGKRPEAESLYLESLPLTESHFDEFYTMWITKELGDSKRESGDIEAARDYYKKSLELINKLGRSNAPVADLWRPSIEVALFEATRGMTWEVRYYRWEKEGTNRIPLEWKNAIQSDFLWSSQVNSVDFDWGRDSPSEHVPHDRFGTVATTKTELPSGRFVIRTVSDDGVRVFVDEDLVIDNWTRHYPTLDTATVELNAGQHSIRIEHFDIDEDASLKFSIESSPERR